MADMTSREHFKTLWSIHRRQRRELGLKAMGSLKDCAYRAGWDHAQATGREVLWMSGVPLTPSSLPTVLAARIRNRRMQVQSCRWARNLSAHWLP